MPEQARIIVVEDTLSLARVYQDYLRADGHKVEHVVTGRDAIQRLRNDPPDVLVLDLILPDMDGRDVLRAAHQAAPECKVVVITAHGSVNVAVEAMRDGAWDFLLKPFTADKLRITVSDALEGRSAISHAVQKSDGVDTVDEKPFTVGPSGLTSRLFL